MKWKKVLLSMALLAALFGGASAEWTLGPGLASPLPTNPAFSTKGWQKETMNVNIPVSRDPNLLKRARINAAVEVETNRFTKSIEKRNAAWKTTGWISWQSAMDKKESPITSFLLVESSYPDRAAHPMSRAVPMNFDGLGHRITLKDLKQKMPNLTVEEVNRQIEIQCSEREIYLFPDHTVRKLPDIFYIGKDSHLYLVFEPYEIGPYASGFIAIDMGMVVY